MVFLPAPFNTSPWSTTATATLTPSSIFTLTAPSNAALGGIVTVAEPPQEVSLVLSGVFNPAGRKNAVVISEGGPLGPQIQVKLREVGTTARQMIDTIMAADTDMLLRDPFGRAWYVRPQTNLTRVQILAAKAAGDVPSVLDLHENTLQLVAIDRPDTGPGVDGLTQLTDTLSIVWIGPPAFNNDAPVVTLNV
jgi:hypothetical protein